MKNMALKESEIKDHALPSVLSSGKVDQPRYPYGLCISLEEESLQKLEIKSLPPVGHSMVISVRVEVVSTGEHDSKEQGVRRSLSLQITDIDMGGAKKEVDLEKLYDSDGATVPGKMYGKLNDNPNQNGG